MSLNERSKAILEETVIDYIQTGNPVGSSHLSKSKGFDVSAATIRNELNHLEKNGYLTQLHTSSGRVPTDKGYRFYVDRLMKPHSETMLDTKAFKASLETFGNNVNDILGYVSQVMSSLVNYTTIVLTPQIFLETLKLIHLILVDVNRVLVVLLGNFGVNREFVLNTDDQMDQEELNKLTNFLNQKLKGVTIADFNQEFVEDIVTVLPKLKPLAEQLFSEIHRLERFHDSQYKVMTGGLSKMLKLPEFQNIELTHKVISALEENKVLLTVFQRFKDAQSKNILIGESDHHVEQLQDCSVVFSPYSKDDGAPGVIGLIGPKRMAYAKALSMVESISGMIDETLNVGQKLNSEVNVG